LFLVFCISDLFFFAQPNISNNLPSK
jgi:hypothetical protein